MKTHIKINLPRAWQMQIYHPYVGKNKFGYFLHLRTSFVIGYHAFSIQLLGFGFGFAEMTWDRMFAKAAVSND